jgi:hypothetical protein
MSLTRRRKLEQTKSGAIEQSADYPLRSFEVDENRTNLLATEDQWQSDGLFSALNVIHPIKWMLEHIFIEKQNSGQGLALRRGGDLPIDGQVRQECGYFLFSHLSWMALVVKEDKVLDPSKVGLGGSDTVVTDANGVAGLLEEFRHGKVLPISR